MHSAVALILAGGFSSRMRGFKPLLPLPLPPPLPQPACSALACVAQTYRAAGIPRIMVVSGHRAEEVEAEARRLELDSVRNPHPEQGMFSSVRAGLQAVFGLQAFQERPAWCFVHPVDIPLVRPLTLRFLWEARHAERPSLPTFRRQEGHPLLLPASLWEAAASWQGERGLQGWLHALPESGGLVRVAVPDRLTLCDMDTDAAYALHVHRAQRGHTLEPAEYRELLLLRGVRTHGLAPGQRLGLAAQAQHALRHCFGQGGAR